MTPAITNSNRNYGPHAIFRGRAFANPMSNYAPSPARRSLTCRLCWQGRWDSEAERDEHERGCEGRVGA